jgi:hypothetical protein
LVSAAKASEYQVSENLAAVSAEEVFLGLDGIDKARERRPSREILEDLWKQDRLSGVTALLICVYARSTFNATTTS